ncbi:MAG TPA: DUF6178 family protein [Syntrophobacteraceae bacterium]|nr:DUF6178 family protein [Syntrophobacteraceae bacterium]
MRVDSLRPNPTNDRSLDLADFCRRLMTLPVKARLDAILAREDAEKVFAGLPVQDFYFSVVEIGPEDSLPFLALAGVDQLNYLFDLQWWKKDRVDPAAAIEWIGRLARAGEEKLLAWLYQVDFELLVTLFKRWITVVPAPEDEDPLEVRDRLPLRTLDDQYFWECRYPQYEDLVQGVLSLLFEVHRGFYQELLNAVYWASSVEMEEEAYRFHRGRLEDRGIPDYYDALEVYRSIQPEQFAADKVVPSFPPEADSPSPSFALAMLSPKDLPAQSLAILEDGLLLDTLQMELASLATRVLVADRLPTDSFDSFRFSSGKVGAYVNLGLQLLGARDPRQALGLLTKHPLEHLFRLANDRISRPARAMRKILRSGRPCGIHCLDSPWLETAELLCEETPKVMRKDPKNPGAFKEDFFRFPRDLKSARHAVEVIDAVGPLLEAPGMAQPELWAKLWGRAQVSDPRDITPAVMVCTAAGNEIRRGVWSPRPFPVHEWAGIFPLLEPGRIREAISRWIREVLKDPRQWERAEAYFAPVLENYALEMESFGPGNAPDPEMVRFFLFTEEE